MFTKTVYTRNLIRCIFQVTQQKALIFQTKLQIRNKFSFAVLNNRFIFLQNIHKPLKSSKRLSKSIERTFSQGSAVLRFSDKHEDSELSNESYLDEVTQRLYLHPGMGHHVLLIQPRLKFGPKADKKYVSELKLEEAVALVNTLPDWKVIEKCIMPVADLNLKLLFGKGNLEKLKKIIQKNPRITSVFIGIDVLTALQITKLEEFFKVQVFDRYQVILQIFHDHARTSEAKLQLALAEIPYLRLKLCSYSHTRDSSTFIDIHHVGGDGESYMQMRRLLLSQRELKLKKELEKIKNQREFLRRGEMRNSLPIIAVVGYTNCGKTTLIKALTEDSRLLPEDKLFATLDVTMHAGRLPSNQKVLFIDTVGFISDVPTALIQSFRSTLEEIHSADLVIHIRDISHPDTEKQKKTVLKTLEELNLPTKLLDSIIEVKNKIDLLKDTETVEDSDPIGISATTVEDSDAIGISATTVKDSDAIGISATEGTGLVELLDIVEQKVFENTGHNISLMRIPNGGPEYSWLLREAAIRDAIADTQDENYLIVEVVISAANLGKFKHNFGDLTVSLESISKYI